MGEPHGHTAPRPKDGSGRAAGGGAGGDGRLPPTRSLQETLDRADAASALEPILDALDVGISVQDREFRVLYQNAAHRALVGSRPGEFCFTAFRGNPGVCPNCQVAQTFGDGKAHTVTQSIERGGETRHMEITASPIRDSAGRVVAAVELVRDVTARRRSEERYRIASDAVSSAMSGIAFADLGGNLIYVNQAFLALWGYDEAAEVLGRPAVEFWDDPGQARQVVETLMAGQGWVGELVGVRRDGTRFHAQLTANRMKGAQGETVGMFASFLDVSARREFEAEVVRSERLESLGALAGGIAHDFNNLLTAILGSVSLVRSRMASGNKDHQRLSEAERACARAQELTRQLLTFARGGAPVTRATCVGDLVQEAAVFALRGSAVQCRYRVVEGLWPVRADEGQLSQVVQNVLLNAAQAMPEGGTVEVALENRTLAQGEVPPLAAGDYVEIAVRDHGVGIPEAHLEKIFDPYFTTKAAGTGLGLASAYSIVKGHGGQISVASQEGVGTVFRIRLPACHEPVEGKKAGEPVSARGSGRVLVMDDDDAVRSVAGEMLVELGYEVVAARDGAEAVDLYAAALAAGSRFDVVVTDLTVPGGMGGREAARKLLDLDPGANVLVSSGYANDPVLANHREFGFQGVIRKPYRFGELAEAVGRALGR